MSGIRGADQVDVPGRRTMVGEHAQQRSTRLGGQGHQVGGDQLVFVERMRAELVREENVALDAPVAGSQVAPRGPARRQRVDESLPQPVVAVQIARGLPGPPVVHPAQLRMVGRLDPSQLEFPATHVDAGRWGSLFNPDGWTTARARARGSLGFGTQGQ